MKYTFSQPYHPVTNVTAECFVEIFKSHVMKIMESGHHNNYGISDDSVPFRLSVHTSEIQWGYASSINVEKGDKKQIFLIETAPVSDNLYEAHVKASNDRNIEFVVGDKIILKILVKVINGGFWE